MADPEALLRGLESYEQCLQNHLAGLQQEYGGLSQSWSRFSSEYDGNAAEQLRQGWQRTMDRFEEYILQTQQMRVILLSRIEALREVAQARDL